MVWADNEKRLFGTTVGGERAYVEDTLDVAVTNINGVEGSWGVWSALDLVKVDPVEANLE